MKRFESTKIKRIKTMSDESEMLKTKNYLEYRLFRQNDKYTTADYIDYLTSGKYTSFDQISEYIEITAKILKIDLSERNLIFNKISSIRQIADRKFADNEQLTELEDNHRKMMCYSHKTKIHWGIYAETTIRDILINDPEYILWCIINLDHFFTVNYIFVLTEVRRSENYLKAMEINAIKSLIDREWTYTDDEGDYDTGDNFDAFEGDYLAWFNYNQ